MAGPPARSSVVQASDNPSNPVTINTPAGTITTVNYSNLTAIAFANFQVSFNSSVSATSLIFLQIGGLSIPVASNTGYPVTSVTNIAAAGSFIINVYVCAISATVVAPSLSGSLQIYFQVI